MVLIIPIIVDALAPLPARTKTRVGERSLAAASPRHQQEIFSTFERLVLPSSDSAGDLDLQKVTADHSDDLGRLATSQIIWTRLMMFCGKFDRDMMIGCVEQVTSAWKRLHLTK